MGILENHLYVVFAINIWKDSVLVPKHRFYKY